MTAADTVILDLVAVLIGRGRDRGLMNHVVNGEQHITSCQRGMWLSHDSPRPDGEPCSKRCREAWAAIHAAADYLYAHRDVLAEVEAILAAAPLAIEQLPLVEVMS